MSRPISRKRQFVADGVFYAELNELLTRELTSAGYSGVAVRKGSRATEVLISVTKPNEVLGAGNRRINELTSIVQKRFKFPEGSLELYAERVTNSGLSAAAQAESLKHKLINGLAVRRACYSVLRNIMEWDAKGCEVIVSGKLRAARAKAMKFRDGYMIHSGFAVNHYIDSAVRHVLMRQGVLGIKVKIMRDFDPTGRLGPSKRLPDIVVVEGPKDEDAPQPYNAYDKPAYGEKGAYVKEAEPLPAAPVA